MSSSVHHTRCPPLGISQLISAVCVIYLNEVNGSKTSSFRKQDLKMDATDALIPDANTILQNMLTHPSCKINCLQYTEVSQTNRIRVNSKQLCSSAHLKMCNLVQKNKHKGMNKSNDKKQQYFLKTHQHATRLCPTAARLSIR
jgi:hypothetical protein